MGSRYHLVFLKECLAGGWGVQRFLVFGPVSWKVKPALFMSVLKVLPRKSSSFPVSSYSQDPGIHSLPSFSALLGTREEEHKSRNPQEIANKLNSWVIHINLKSRARSSQGLHKASRELVSQGRKGYCLQEQLGKTSWRKAEAFKNGTWRQSTIVQGHFKELCMLIRKELPSWFLVFTKFPLNPITTNKMTP